eukprot:3999830-Prymnesium_polylepis.1
MSRLGDLDGASPLRASSRSRVARPRPADDSPRQSQRHRVAFARLQLERENFHEMLQQRHRRAHDENVLLDDGDDDD